MHHVLHRVLQVLDLLLQILLVLFQEPDKLLRIGARLEDLQGKFCFDLVGLDFLFDLFDLLFKVENLKFMSADYTVRISSKGISHFSTNGGKLQYFIATESR